MTFFLTIVFVVLVFWRPQEWLVPQLQGWPLLDAVVYTALLGLLMEVQQGKLRFPKTPAVGLLFGLWIMSAFSHVPHTYAAGIIETLDLLRPIYSPTAYHGHFGREPGEGGKGTFTWERTDVAPKLAKAARRTVRA